MDIKDLPELLDRLKSGEVSIIYKKSDQTITIMSATLQPEKFGYIPKTQLDETVERSSTNLKVWCIDRNGWRSLTVENIQLWAERSSADSP